MNAKERNFWIDLAIKDCEKHIAIADRANLPEDMIAGRYGWMRWWAYENLVRLGVDLSQVDMIDISQYHGKHTYRYNYKDLLKQLLKLQISEVTTAPRKLEEAQDPVRPPSSLTAVDNGDIPR